MRGLKVKILVVLLGSVLMSSVAFSQYRILHSPPKEVYESEPIVIEAVVEPAGEGAVRVTLYYRVAGTDSYNEIEMALADGVYKGTIPGDFVTSAGVEYLIVAEFQDGTIVAFPEVDIANQFGATVFNSFLFGFGKAVEFKEVFALQRVNFIQLTMNLFADASGELFADGLFFCGISSVKVLFGECGEVVEEVGVVFEVELTRIIFNFRSGDEGVGADEFEVEVGQRQDASVVFFLIDFFVHDEREKEAEFGNFDGDGLDVHAVDGVLNDAEFASIVGFVSFEGVVDFVEPAVLFWLAEFHGLDLRDLGIEPEVVFGIDLAQSAEHFLEDADGEGAGAAGGVEHFDGAEGVDDGAAGFVVEVMRVVVVHK